jgi:predicted protein tyrosine phosphatase
MEAMKQVIVLSRYEIERVQSWLVPTAVISITDPSIRGPHENRAKIVADGNLIGLLRLAFHDTDPVQWRVESPTPEEWAASGNAGPVAMTDEQAASALSFWKSTALLIEDLVIHCEAGISRSAGVAAAICALAELDDRWCYQHHRPNAHVKAAILRCARKGISNDPR